MPPELDIPPRFYGALVETTVRVLTWNVWGLYGPWRARERAIVATLQEADADIVILTESWERGDDRQAARLAGPLDLPHHVFSGVTAQEDEAALSGVAIVSRWPIVRRSSIELGELRVQFAEVAGPRGRIQVYGVVMDAWWFDQSKQRQEAVLRLLEHLHPSQEEDVPLVVGGDFNADPDSDEIRLLTGRSAAPAPGLSFYDVWEAAPDRPDGPGHTWSHRNPWATQLLWPDRRIDYLFSATPRRGGAGHPLRTSLTGDRAVDGVYGSDHYALHADLRY